MSVKAIIKVVLFCIGTIMTFVASVSPEEASSNIAAWFNIIGVGDLPSWLSSEQTNTIVLVVGIILLLAVFAWMWFERNKRKGKLVPLSNAATRVFEKLNAMGDSAHINGTHQFDIPEEKLNYIAEAIAQHVQIYARYPPDTRMVLVKEMHMFAGNFHDSGNTFKLYDNPNIFFQDCAMRESDIKTAIDELGKFKV